jgi:hypothetical protein
MTLSSKEKQEALDLVKEYGTLREASEASGIPYGTLYDRAQKAKADFADSRYNIPPLPEDDIPIDEVIDHLHSRFKKRKANRDAKKWIPIEMKSDEPIGLLWMGDPHIDDNYCDWDNLREHLRIINEYDGVYGCNLGDYQNNWVGRLGRLYGG